MPYKEKEIEKMFYSIGEVADMFNVNTSHIRFWSKQFDVIKPATNKKGNRLFTVKDVENFKTIYHLVKEKGFTLKGAMYEMAAMRKKMRLEAKPEVAHAAGYGTQEHMTPLPDLFVAEEPQHDSIVDRMALKNSLEKIKASMLQLRNELETLEE
jgi:DNA-binding transcriptional MerR regulator